MVRFASRAKHGSRRRERTERSSGSPCDFARASTLFRGSPASARQREIKQAAPGNGPYLGTVPDRMRPLATIRFVGDGIL